MAKSEPKMIRCYAVGIPKVWEAFCLDFDLAVQGRSFQEVYGKLNDQIALYLESVDSLPEADRKRLLNRRAPLHCWIRQWFAVFSSQNINQGQERAVYNFRLDDGLRAA